MSPVDFASYGPVVVRWPDEEARIGYYDDDHWEYDDHASGDDEGVPYAVVHYSEPPFLYGSRYEHVDHEYLFPIDTEALFSRRDELSHLLFMADRASWDGNASADTEADADEKFRWLLEYSYVRALLVDRVSDSALSGKVENWKRIFISHSSRDKRWASSLAVDLANSGHEPWLDAWEISAGESIPLKVSDGIECSDFVVVLMSKASMESGWVEAEWASKYWDEISERRIHVIPVLLEECSIPRLLKPKKYVDLRHDYSSGLSEILQAIRRFS